MTRAKPWTGAADLGVVSTAADSWIGQDDSQPLISPPSSCAKRGLSYGQALQRPKGWGPRKAASGYPPQVMGLVSNVILTDTHPHNNSNSHKDRQILTPEYVACFNVSNPLSDSVKQVLFRP